jgi:hypothetical protein
MEDLMTTHRYETDHGEVALLIEVAPATVRDEWARKDPNLQWVRDDADFGARFAEIVGSA